MVWKITQKSFERLGVVAHVDEHEPAPRADFKLGQLVVGLRHVWEVPMTWNRLQASVEVPRPTVKRTAQFYAASGAILERAAAVQARVWKRANGLVATANNERLEARDFINRVVSGAWDLFFATCELPAAFPESFNFEVVKFLRGVAIDRNLHGGEILGGLQAQDIRYRTRVCVEQCLVVDARRASLPRAGYFCARVIRHGQTSRKRVSTQRAS